MWSVAHALDEDGISEDLKALLFDPQTAAAYWFR